MADMRATFKSTADRVRKNSRFAIAALVLLLCLIAISVGLQWKLAFIALWVACALGLVGLLLLGVFGEKICCPNCNGQLMTQLGPYCPECASMSISRGSPFASPTCMACGKVMARSRGRRYRIKACTHCGSLLDDIGV
jgi:hypothetical protein